MNVLMLSTDRKIFERGSMVRERIVRYGAMCKELHVLVFNNRSDGNITEQLSRNIWAHPTNSRLKLWQVFVGYRLARRIMRSGKPWVVTAQDPFETGIVACLIAARCKLPFQVQVHTDVYSPKFRCSSFVNRVRAFIAPFVLSRAHGIRVVSDRIKQSLLERNIGDPNRIATLPIFVDASRFPAFSRERHMNVSCTVLMASRLTREKNIPLALRAFQIIAAKHPRAILKIVGSGPEEKRIRRLAESLKISGQVRVDPWTESIASCYEQADIFLLTSDFEGYGRTVVEAMSSGLPVVMTDVGVAGELVRSGENGMVAPVGDENALSSALESLIRDSVLRMELGTRARRTVERVTGTFESYLASYRRSLESLRLKTKLCVVLPEYRSDAHTHFAYLGDLIASVADTFETTLVVERGEKPRGIPGVNYIFYCGNRLSLVRLLKTEVALWRARWSGCGVFYVHYSFYAAYTASWIARITGARVFYWNCGEPWKYRRGIARELFERIVYKLIHVHVTGTEGLRRAYGEHYGIPPRKGRVMPNWINLGKIKNQKSKIKTDATRAALGINEDQKIILFVHRLSKRKGAHYLPDIAQRLSSLIPDSTFIMLVVGDGPEREAMESKIKKQKAKNTVRFLGWVPQRELVKYYAIAEVFLMPSDEEGFPHALLEAMAHGVPFVASDVGGVREIVPPELQKFVVSAGDCATVAQAVHSIVTQSERERATQQKIMAAWVEQYDVGRVAETFTELVGG